MTAWKPYSFSGLSATCILLLVLSAESSAVARGGFPHDEPWSSERIDRLPPRNTKCCPSHVQSEAHRCAILCDLRRQFENSQTAL